MARNMWPTSENGRLKFIIDIYFDDTISDEDKYLIIKEKGSIYLDFYNYLKINNFKDERIELEKDNMRVLKI